MSITPQRCRKHKHLKAWSPIRLLKSAFFSLTDSISSFQLFQCCHFFLQFSSQKEPHSMISASLSINFTALEFKVCSSGLKNGFKFVISSPPACYRSLCTSVCFKKKTTGGGKERTLYFLHSSFISTTTTTTGSLHLQLQKQIDSNRFSAFTGWFRCRITFPINMLLFSLIQPWICIFSTALPGRFCW